MDEFKPLRIFRKENKNIGVYKTISSLKKDLIKERGNICEDCGNEFKIELDHIIPICIGGLQTNKSNVKLKCYRCHREKTRKDIIIINCMKKLGMIKKESCGIELYVELGQAHSFYFHCLKLYNISNINLEKYYNE